MASTTSFVALLLLLLVLKEIFVEGAGGPRWIDTTTLNHEDELHRGRVTIPSFLRNYTSPLGTTQTKKYKDYLQKNTLGEHGIEFCQDAKLMCDSNSAILDPILKISMDALENEALFSKSYKWVANALSTQFDENLIIAKGKEVDVPENLQDLTWPSPTFLPHVLAEKMSFSSVKVKWLLDTFHIKHDSKLAVMMAHTISHCKFAEEKHYKNHREKQEKEHKGLNHEKYKDEYKEFYEEDYKHGNKKFGKGYDMEKHKGFYWEDHKNEHKGEYMGFYQEGQKEFDMEDHKGFHKEGHKDEYQRKPNGFYKDEENGEHKEKFKKEYKEVHKEEHKGVYGEQHKDEYKKFHKELELKDDHKGFDKGFDKKYHEEHKEEHKGFHPKNYKGFYQKEHKEFHKEELKGFYQEEYKNEEKAFYFDKEEHQKEPRRFEKGIFKEDHKGFQKGDHIDEHKGFGKEDHKKDFYKEGYKEEQKGFYKEKYKGEHKGDHKKKYDGKQKGFHKKEYNEEQKEVSIKEQKGGNMEFHNKEPKHFHKKEHMGVAKCIISMKGLTSFLERSLPEAKHIRALERSSALKFGDIKKNNLKVLNGKKAMWKVLDFKKHDQAVVCINNIFPFALFECHNISKIKNICIYSIKLEGKSGVHRYEIALCYKKEIDFLHHKKDIDALKKKKIDAKASFATVSACHWISNALVWAPTI